MENRINILLGSDINYAPYYGVMLSSLFRHNTECQFDVYLLTDSSWTDYQTRKFTKLAKKYNSRFFVYPVDEEQMKVCPASKTLHVTRTTYYRLMAGYLLPETIDKILYLDGDMVVCGDIKELWNTDMTNLAIAGAIDSLQFDDETYERLGYDKKHGYINVGTELMNLKYLREHKIAEKALEFIRDYKGELLFMDQDVINTILADKKGFIPIKYNFITMYLTNYFSRTYPKWFMEDVLANMNNPVIIHYGGEIKPWHWRYYKAPYRKIWMQEYWHSPWRFEYQIKPLSKYFKHLIKRVVMPQKLYQHRAQLYIEQALGLKTF